MEFSKYQTIIDRDVDQQSRIESFRYLCRVDLFFLLYFIFGRKDVDHPWLVERIREVEKNPDNHLDLWPRAHYKSTIITFGKTIQDILKSHGEAALIDRELTFGIFSHTRPIAKGFLGQIKREFETNDRLFTLFPDILYSRPHREAVKWSEDGGIIVQRKTNPKEATIEAWGLVDGQPTSKHFGILVYDDVVTRESVTTPDQIDKTTTALELSYNLGDTHNLIRRFIGTRYHFNDTYKTIIERNTVTLRKYTATDDGKTNGNPVFLSKETLDIKRRDMGPYVFSSQMMQNPIADGIQSFKLEWIRYYHDDLDKTGNTNFYLLVDPANSKKKSSDYTAIFVIGLHEDGNYYIADIVRDRLSLRERVDMVFRLHRMWKPIRVGYEKYGLQADIDYIKIKQEEIKYRFDITELGGALSKEDRIKRLIPLFERGKIYFPAVMYRMNYEGKSINLIDSFINDEYLSFPSSIHDDMLDCLARIIDDDLQVTWPEYIEKEDAYSRRMRKRVGGMCI